MDPMVVKYIGLAWVVYGVHGILAFAQVGLALYLIMNGRLLLSKNNEIGKWGTRFGLTYSDSLAEKPLAGWLIISTGVALLLPVLGVTFWLAVIACPFGFYWLIALKKNALPSKVGKLGRLIQNGLLVGTVFIFTFTIWEQKDLVKTSALITYKAAYWQIKEVQIWQKENNPNVPKVGDMPPDFELTDVNGINTVRLSEFRGQKPVVLLFGSFT